MSRSVRPSRDKDILDEKVQARVHTSRYALFFVSSEGRYLPAPGWDDIEEASGYVLLPNGRVFSFWLGWDPTQEGPELIEWEEESPQESWLDSPEYRDARVAVGLLAA